METALHTLEEAAEILRVPYRKVRDEVFAGRWPHVRISQRKRLMTDRDINAVIEALHQAPTPAPPAVPTRGTRQAVLRYLNT